MGNEFGRERKVVRGERKDKSIKFLSLSLSLSLGTHTLTNPREFRNVSSPSPMFCSAYVSATRSAYPPPFDSIKKPTNIVDNTEPNMMAIPPAKTVRNSLSGMFAMSESMVEINMDDDADIASTTGGSQRFREVVVVVVAVVRRRRDNLPDADAGDVVVVVVAVGANDATRSHDDEQASAANSAPGVDLFIFVPGVLFCVIVVVCLLPR